MRVTFVLPDFDLGGGNRVVATYADQLHRRGHEVFLVGLPPRPVPLLRRLKDWVRGRGWRAQPKQGPSHCDSLEVPRLTLERWRPVVDPDVPDADVVIATWWETVEWVAKLSPSKGVKVHFVQGDEADPLWLPPEMARRAEAVCRLPLYKITISRWLFDMLGQRYGAKQVSLVSNSVDQNLFHAPPRGKQARPTVGLVYSPMRIKGCDVSLAAVRQVSRLSPQLKLVAFGHGDVQPQLTLPPGASYQKSPAQHQIRDLYRQCDVWVCGSRSEGFALPPLEAMACRCPVVSTRVGGMTDIIEEGINGHLVQNEDVEALADRLARVLALPEASWRAMSEAAYQTATRYTWDDATDLFEEALYTAVAGSNQSGPSVRCLVG